MDKDLFALYERIRREAQPCGSEGCSAFFCTSFFKMFYITWRKFRTFYFGHFLSPAFQKNFGQKFRTLCWNIAKVTLGLQNKSLTETTSVKWQFYCSLKALEMHWRERNTDYMKSLRMSSSVSTRVRSLKPGIKETRNFEATSKFYTVM